MANLGTFLTMLLVFTQLVWSKNLKKFSFLLLVDTLIFSLLVNSGYFIKLGTLDLDYEEALMICFIIVSLINGGLYRIRSLLLKKSFLLLFIAAIGIVLLVFNPNKTFVMPVGGSWDAYYAGKIELIPLEFSANNIERFFRLLLFLIVLFSLNNLLKEKEYRERLIKAIIIICAIQVVLGYLDFVMKSILNLSLLQSFANSFFGSEFRTDIIPERANAVFIHAFMLEPSHFSSSFIPGLTILALLPEKNPKKALLEIAAIVILLLSGSFRGFGIVFYWIVLKLYKCLIGSKKVKITTPIVLLLIMIIVAFLTWQLAEYIPLISYYMSRFMGLVGFGPVIGSESIRLLSITTSLEFLSRNPFFGIGIGSTNAHGFIPSMLSNIGILGFIAWLLFFSDALNIKKKSYFPLTMWIILAMLTGDIGWLYNGMGIAMLIGVSFASFERKNGKTKASKLDLNNEMKN